MDGSSVWITGVFTEVLPRTRLSCSWIVRHGELPALDESQVTVRFEPRLVGTEVIIVHERVANE
ncbi:MAG: hypothetical protein ACI9OJ_004923 [Myxococcota bacterium]|jgi:uncharacterized protein YndB with AHSA1/START domain